FTLLGDARRGRRPSFTEAAPGPEAEPLVELFARELEARGVPTSTGSFGAHMEVELVNDGPVTLDLDFRRSGGGYSPEPGTLDVHGEAGQTETDAQEREQNGVHAPCRGQPGQIPEERSR